MTFTVTPQPERTPPRVRMDIGSDDPAKSFTTLVVYRDGKPVREQPYIGGPEAVVYDYEAPFGVPATYEVVGTAATYAVVRAETWASLSGWTTVDGTPTVAGGRFSGGTASRAVTLPTEGRLDCAALIASAASIDKSAVASISLGSLDIQNNGSLGGPGLGSGVARFGDAPWVGGITGLESPFSVTWDAASATIVTQTGVWIVSRGADNAPANTVTVDTYYPTDFVEDFTISTGSLTPFAGTQTVTLDVTEAWLIHPKQSALSVSIDPGQHKFRDDGVNVARASKSSVSRAAKATRHDAVGSDRAVVFTTGPRSAGEWELLLRTRRLADRDAVVSICQDQAPLLLRSPIGWVWDLPDGWYTVADVDESRPREGLHHADREINLPLTPSREPVARMAAEWTYAADLMRNPTYAESRAEFPTYLDRLVGP